MTMTMTMTKCAHPSSSTQRCSQFFIIYIFNIYIINFIPPSPPCREGVHILSSSSSSPASPFSVLKMLTPPQISLTPLLDVLTSPAQSVDLTHDLLTYKRYFVDLQKIFCILRYALHLPTKNIFRTTEKSRTASPSIHLRTAAKYTGCSDSRRWLSPSFRIHNS
jgi:hypothetical protein